jgi:hypothetical protein
MERLEIMDIQSWQEKFPKETQTKATEALENGKIIFFPKLAFELSEPEKSFLVPDYVNPKSKNISFDINTATIKGFIGLENTFLPLKKIMERYATSAKSLIETLFPNYKNALEIARTSFRPVEILGRTAPSFRKDDTRLHVDAFPSNPNQGRRILRIFTNINPEGKKRVWRMGETFEQVAQTFFPKLNNPFPGSAKLLQLFKITKGYRTDYDHFMLQMHNAMKADTTYQKKADQMEILFPANSTWIVYTDCVSHAAMSGQHLLEQTFHLPVSAMESEIRSPLRKLSK